MRTKDRGSKGYENLVRTKCSGFTVYKHAQATREALAFRTNQARLCSFLTVDGVKRQNISGLCPSVCFTSLVNKTTWTHTTRLHRVTDSLRATYLESKELALKSEKQKKIRHKIWVKYSTLRLDHFVEIKDSRFSGFFNISHKKKTLLGEDYLNCTSSRPDWKEPG